MVKMNKFAGDGFAFRLFRQIPTQKVQPIVAGAPSSIDSPFLSQIYSSNFIENNHVIKFNQMLPMAMPLFLSLLLSSMFLMAFGQLSGNNEVSDFEQPADCGTSATEWKPCIERRIADQVFGSCCERFVPPECRGICTYESHPIEARILLMHTIQPSRCRLYKYLPAIVHCAAQTHDNTACCRDMGMHEIGPTCLDLCRPQTNPRELWGIKSLRKDLVQCLAKWDQVMFCHQSGLRARKIKTAAAVAASASATIPTPTAPAAATTTTASTTTIGAGRQ